MEHLVGFCRAMKTRLNQMTTLGYLGNGKTRLETELARTGVWRGSAWITLYTIGWELSKIGRAHV